MKWRGGGFDNLRQHGKEVGQTARTRTSRNQSVGYRKELFEVCQHPYCGLTRLHHERGPLLPDHAFVPPKES
jgi:hypothetical protein